MMQHKENVLSQPASPAAFCCIKNKKKIKGISKIQHINIITKKKELKKEPKRSRTENENGRLKNMIRKKIIKNGGKNTCGN